MGTLCAPTELDLAVSWLQVSICLDLGFLCFLPREWVPIVHWSGPIARAYTSLSTKSTDYCWLLWPQSGATSSAATHSLSVSTTNTLFSQLCLCRVVQLALVDSGT